MIFNMFTLVEYVKPLAPINTSPLTLYALVNKLYLIRRLQKQIKFFLQNFHFFI